MTSSPEYKSVEPIVKKQYYEDFEIRDRQYRQMGTSFIDHPYSQRPDVDFDEDDIARAQRAYIGDRRVGEESTRSPHVIETMNIAREDSELWEEQLKDVSLPVVAGGKIRPIERYEPKSVPLSEKPVAPGEVQSVLNNIIRGIALRTERQKEIAAYFTDDEIAELKEAVTTERAQRFDDELMSTISFDSENA